MHLVEQGPSSIVGSTANGAPVGPQPGLQATQQSPLAGQGQQQQEALATQPQPQPQNEGEAMLGRINAVHADVDSLTAKVGL